MHRTSRRPPPTTPPAAHPLCRDVPPTATPYIRAQPRLKSGSDLRSQARCMGVHRHHGLKRGVPSTGRLHMCLASEAEGPHTLPHACMHVWCLGRPAHPACRRKRTWALTSTHRLQPGNPALPKHTHTYTHTHPPTHPPTHTLPFQPIHIGRRVLSPSSPCTAPKVPTFIATCLVPVAGSRPRRRPPTVNIRTREAVQVTVITSDSDSDYN